VANGRLLGRTSSSENWYFYGKIIPKNHEMKASIVLLFFLSFFAQQSFAQKQKVKIKDEIASVDGVDYLQWKKVKGANAVSVFELGSDDEVIFVRWVSYDDPSKISNANPKGSVRWVELQFLELELTCEVDSRGNKGLVKFFLEDKLFVNGELDTAAVEKLVKKYGRNYSDNRPESIIIINN
jgi:hypothetical protein